MQRIQHCGKRKSQTLSYLKPLFRSAYGQYRNLLTLAIETSCDDTAVAILQTPSHSQSLDPGGPKAKLLFNEKLTADSTAYKGIHPLVALESHQRNLASLVQRATTFLPALSGIRAEDNFANGDCIQPRKSSSVGTGSKQCKRVPDFISVTRGPGMRSNLSVGLDTAKGLAIAWGVPLVGVHHMQAHALTPGLIAALKGIAGPRYPFLTLLVSGGHTILVLSSTLTDHHIIADSDMPVGSALDKIARLTLPEERMAQTKSTMYGAVLEQFAFPEPVNFNYKAPAGQIRRQKKELYSWSFNPPLSDAKGGAKKDNMEFCFSGLVSATERFITYDQLPDRETRTLRTESVRDDERQALAREAMRVSFEHLASRVILALERSRIPINDLVVSGGVASNRYLRHILSAWLEARNFSQVQLHCPPPAFCTDNAAMIAWAGCEMYKQGWRSELSVTARRKWPLSSTPNADADTTSGTDSEKAVVGVLGADGWFNVAATASFTS